MWNGIQSWLFTMRLDICLAGLLLTATVYLVRPKREITLIWILAAVAFFTATRFGQFQVQGIHAHDVYHYQIGSKYTRELRYTGIYEATATALTELEAEKKIPPETCPKTIRDLNDKGSPSQLVDAELKARAKQRFSETRWDEFKKDIYGWNTEFRLPWQRVLNDAGYNPSPWWSTMGAAANLFFKGAENYRNMVWIDIALLLACFVLIGNTFGQRAAAYAAALTFFFPPGSFAPFDYTGMSLLRISWVFWLSAAFCAFHTKRFRLAGAALALATLERIFPGAWALSAVIILLALATNQPKILASWKPLINLAIGGIVTTIAVIGVSSALLGPDLWTEFLGYIPKHTGFLFTNHLGWVRGIAIHAHIQEVAFPPGNLEVLRDWSNILMDRKNWPLHLLAKGLILAGCLIWATRRKDTSALAWLGAAIIFLFTIPAQYYAFGLLPAYAAIFGEENKTQENHRMGISIIFVAAASTLVLNAGEVAGWAIASVLMICAMAAGTGSLATPNHPIKGAVFGAIAVLLIIISPQFQMDEARKLRAKTWSNTKTIQRNYIAQNSKEVSDRGYILGIGAKVEIQTRTLNNHTLYIRTDQVFQGTLTLLNSAGKEIMSWEVQPRSSIFYTLSTPIPPGQKFALRWDGPGRDIGIFSIWTR